MEIYGIIKKETKRVPIFAGMQASKIKKVGYKVIEFTYDCNPEVEADKMLISTKEIKRVINH
jgi:hypothetical protein